MKKYVVCLVFILGIAMTGYAADNVNAESNTGLNSLNAIVKPAAKPVTATPKTTASAEQQKQVPENSGQKQDVAKTENNTDHIADNEFGKKIRDLENQRREVSLEIYELRVSLIQEDPDLKILHKTIVDLHEKMAQQLNKNAKMQTLLTKAKDIDNKMADLIATREKDKK